MTYKLKNLPSPRATTAELTDFVEIECLKSANQSYTLESAARALGILSDENEAAAPLNDEDDVLHERMISVSEEIENRMRHTGGNYPFILSNGGYTIKANNDIGDFVKYSYLYLLFLTRLKMAGPNSIGLLNGVDGALMFEAFSLNVIKNYFGERAHGLVFGTSVGGAFDKKVDHLIQSIGEGGKFRSKDYDPTNANDSKLDSVVWINFKDKRGAKVICFIQSKTGTSWKPYINQLIPTQFTKKWFLNQPILEPINAFVVADILRENFYEHSVEKLFFDRCRLMDYLPNTMDEINDQIISWTNGAMEYIGANPIEIQNEVEG